MPYYLGNKGHESFQPACCSINCWQFMKVSELIEIILETDTIEYFFNNNSAPACQQRPIVAICKAVHAAYFERSSNKLGIFIHLMQPVIPTPS
jgi:hypothetical protein